VVRIPGSRDPGNAVSSIAGGIRAVPIVNATVPETTCKLDKGPRDLADAVGSISSGRASGSAAEKRGGVKTAGRKTISSPESTATCESAAD
jgi:hypothetical protein